MLDVDFDDLDLGSKRKPTEWVAMLPASAQQPRQRSSRYVQKQSRCSLLSAASSTQQWTTYSKQYLETAVFFVRCTMSVASVLTCFTYVHRQLLKAQKMQQAHKKQQEDKPQGAVKKQGIPASTHAARMQQLAECTDVRQPRPISEEDAAAGAQAFPAENDEGNVEYKLRLKEPNCSPVRFQQLVTCPSPMLMLTFYTVKQSLHAVYSRACRLLAGMVESLQ